MKAALKSELEKGLSKAWHIIDFSPPALETFAETGRLSTDCVLSENCVDILKNACSGLFDRKFLPFTRHVKDPDWHNVDKVTLFRPETIPQTSHDIRLFAPELAIAATWSDELVKFIGRGLKNIKFEEASLALAGFRCNRAVINRMRGTPHQPAIIGTHTDVPQEKGANVALVLDGGTNLLNGEEVPSGRINVYACKDTCEALGIERPAHGFSSTANRIVPVFTRFKAE